MHRPAAGHCCGIRAAHGVPIRQLWPALIVCDEETRARSRLVPGQQRATPPAEDDACAVRAADEFASSW